MAKPYVIWTPSGYNPYCGGIKVLHNLCHLLNEGGYEAYINQPEFHPEWNEKYYTGGLDDFIAVYPEIVEGNPLGGAKVVRWLLNRQYMDYQSTDIIIYFSKVYAPDYFDENVFYIPLIDYEKYIDRKGERDLVLVYGGKGGTREQYEQMEGKKQGYFIDNIKTGDIDFMVEILNRGKVLYSYDGLTAVGDMARLCGCPFVILEGGNKHGQVRIEAIEHGEAGTYGLYYGESEIKEFDSDRYRRHYETLKPDIKKFIRLTQGQGEA